MDEHWKVFCETAGEEGLRDDPRFGSISLRLANIDACYAAVAAVIAGRDSGAWLELLGNSCVPIMRVNTLDDLLEDPHLNETGFWQQHQHPTEGSLRMPSPPFAFSETPALIRRLPPLLGEHSREVLAEAGYDPAAIGQLLEAGVVIDAAGRD
jgi:crotonobetainyl-CoA:carnitine CoA-transferase CaiB-like acyl-CoA transferase